MSTLPQNKYLLYKHSKAFNLGNLSATPKITIKQKKMEKVKTLSILVPRAGVEPAQVSLLVFETSASTDSAIWAPYKKVFLCFAVQR